MDLDGKQIMRWEGKHSSLSLLPSIAMPNLSCFGFSSDFPSVFRDVRLRMLDGEAKVLSVEQAMGKAPLETPATAGKQPSKPVELPSEKPSSARRKLIPGKVVDLLKLVDLSRDTVAGSWELRGGLEIRKATGLDVRPRLMIPYTPRGSYELGVEFKRSAGDKRVGVVLPVGNSAVVLFLGTNSKDGTVHGLAKIGGVPISLYVDNKTVVRPGTLDTGKAHRARIVVITGGREAEIIVHLDDKQLIHWKGPQSSLSVPTGMQLPKSGCIGLHAYARTSFTAVRLRLLLDKTDPKPESIEPSEEPLDMEGEPSIPAL